MKPNEGKMVDFVEKLNQATEDFQQKIKQKDLLTSRCDGVNLLDLVKYTKSCRGGVRRRIEENGNN